MIFRTLRTSKSETQEINHWSRRSRGILFSSKKRPKLFEQANKSIDKSQPLKGVPKFCLLLKVTASLFKIPGVEFVSFGFSKLFRYLQQFERYFHSPGDPFNPRDSFTVPKGQCLASNSTKAFLVWWVLED